ncbi:MAG TPA: TRAP transporter large permease [Ferrovibrio sp.]|uniref:TRAP transporter large permease n=1 Tax=Ferrovibrio sp. TaxID=1917215 RepID=UPI002ED22251
MFVMLAVRVPIGLAMLTVGMAGYTVLNGWLPLLSYLKAAPFQLFSSNSLSVIPLFLLMGQLASRAGLSRALFRAAYVWLGHCRGGVAMAAIGSCAGFGAICGSSLATAATMGQVALPELRRFKYSGALATGTLAAGGTLGILIPPSVILVIYAILTEQNIAKLFIAAFVPGVLAAVGYMIAIAVYVRVNPEAGPAGPRTSWAERLESLRETWPVLMIFALVIGGIYLGWFTPTEGAAVGVLGTGVMAFTQGGMRWSGFLECLLEAARATAMIFLILLGADLLNAFLGLSRLPMEAASAIGNSGLPAYAVLLAILLLYLVLGCLMDSLSMILLTIPIFFPVIMALDFGMTPEHTAIWFGILALIVVEVGLITPPVGMNVFVINGMAKGVSMGESFRGVVPFLISDFIRVTLLILFPAITLFSIDLLF